MEHYSQKLGKNVSTEEYLQNHLYLLSQQKSLIQEEVKPMNQNKLMHFLKVRIKKKFKFFSRFCKEYNL